MIQVTPDAVNVTQSESKPKRRRASKPPTPPPPPPKKRAPVKRLVTGYLASLSEHHAAAADVLGAEFKRALRDELALDAKAAALAERRENLEHDLAYVVQAFAECVPSKACRARLDVLARAIAHGKGGIAAAEAVPTGAIHHDRGNADPLGLDDAPTAPVYRDDAGRVIDASHPLHPDYVLPY